MTRRFYLEHKRSVWAFSSDWENTHYTGIFVKRIWDTAKLGIFVIITVSDYITMETMTMETILGQSNTKNPALPTKYCSEINEPIDIVYTWVNGSDPDFQDTIHQFKLEHGEIGDGELVSRRFHGNRPLLKINPKYIFRYGSIEVFAEVDRNVCFLDKAYLYCNEWTRKG